MTSHFKDQDSQNAFWEYDKQLNKLLKMADSCTQQRAEHFVSGKIQTVANREFDEVKYKFRKYIWRHENLGKSEENNENYIPPVPIRMRRVLQE